MIGEEGMVLTFPKRDWRFRLDVRGKFFTESGEVLAQAARGGGRVTVPGGVVCTWH